MPTKTAERTEITPFTAGMAEETMELDGKKYPWGRYGGAHIKDPAIARELEKKYEGRVIMSPIQSPDVHDRGHRYFFGGWPEMPWKKNKENDNADKLSISTSGRGVGRNGGSEHDRLRGQRPGRDATDPA